MRRLNYRKGDYLVQTDGLGEIVHRSECDIQYDGKLKVKDNIDPRHPQEFVRAKKINLAIKNARPISEPVESFVTPEDLGYI